MKLDLLLTKWWSIVAVLLQYLQSAHCSVVIRNPSTNVCEDESMNHCTIHAIETFSSVKHDAKASVLGWHGVPASPIEHQSVQKLRMQAQQSAQQEGLTWLSTVTDVELLRFLRAKHGHEDEAWKMLSAHVLWRNSTYGADSPFTATFFQNSPLQHEVFWMGPNKEGCPTLVVRSQIHDGIYYNEDPYIFTSFLVHKLEEGRQLYGVGTERPVCVLLDRAGTVFRNGKKKIEKFDMAVIPNLVELFRHMYSTFMNNYPDLLLYAKIAPASWFFSMCYKVTSRVMDAKSRERFQMIKESEIKDRLHSVFDAALLPEHLLGSGVMYNSTIDVIFDPATVTFPSRVSKKAKKH